MADQGATKLRAVKGQDKMRASVRRRSRAGGGLQAAGAITTAMSMASALASAALSVLALALVLPATTSRPRFTASAHTGSSKLALIQPPTIELDPDITLVVGPTLVFESGQWVTVSWTGIESWMFPDAFVAAFSPGSALDNPDDIMEVAPIKYQYLTAEKPFPGEASSEADGESESESEAVEVEVEAVAGGVGEAAESLRFRLLNLRDVEGYRFGLFKGGVKKPVLVAKTEEAVIFAQPYEVRVFLWLLVWGQRLLWRACSHFDGWRTRWHVQWQPYKPTETYPVLHSQVRQYFCSTLFFPFPSETRFEGVWFLLP